jgi:hypothetical protein
MSRPPAQCPQKWQARSDFSKTTSFSMSKKQTHIHEIVQLGQDPHRLLQRGEPRLLLIQSRKAEKLAKALLLFRLQESFARRVASS